MAALINKIIAKGGTTAHRQLFEEQEIIEQYIDTRYGIHCAVAVDNSDIVGFQALEWADPNWQGPDKVPEYWAIIATFVALGHQRQGVGRRLFEATLAAAQAVDVRCIDATIRCENVGGQAFYDRMGFVDYRKDGATISKKLVLA